MDDHHRNAWRELMEGGGAGAYPFNLEEYTKIKRRADEEGRSFQRKDGRWVAQVSVADIFGGRRLVQRYAKTQAAARRNLTGLKSRQDATSPLLEGKGSVRDWLDLADTFIKSNRAARTYVSYHGILKDHVPDTVGKLPLMKLSSETLQVIFNKIANEKGHGRTANLLRSVLRSAFNRAVKLGRMEANPVLGTDPVDYVERSSGTFTPEQGKRFLEVAADDRLGALFMIALSLGLRKGEVCG